MIRAVVSLVLTLVFAVAAVARPLTVAERDPAIEARIADLLARMTLEEKIGQMFMESWTEQLDLARVRAGDYGSIINFPSEAEARRAQAAARESRLGIPLLIGRDVVHGYRTLFPVPLGLAAAFDRDTWRTSFEWIAREAASDGLNIDLGPMVDISRDGRWGRTVEGAGEDPWLSARFAEASVTGLKRGGLGAALKHFIGYGAPRAGRDYAEADISTATLHDVHLPPFEAALSAGAEIVMAAFNTLNGVPGTANPRMTQDLLERRLGFDGLVLTDWDAIRELMNHGVAGSPEQATERAINSGIDMEIAGKFVPNHLPGLVRSGRVPMARIDDAVARILRVKFRLGLMDPPGSVTAAAAPVKLGSPEIRAAARAAAQKSIVLLKNEGDLLPLVKPPKRIVVVGHSAVDPSDMMGAWGAVAVQEETTTFFEEFKRRMAPLGSRVVYSEGCDDDCLEPISSEFSAATSAGRKADLIVAVLGEPWYMTAESTSRTRLGLPNHQQELLDRLARTGRPVVLVTLAGRGLVMTEAMPKAKAVLYAFAPGTMGAAALVDLLTGEANFSARLPVGLPRSVGQLPMSYDALPTGRPQPGRPGDDLWSRYVDEEITPLFPFGFGLSYTRFVHGEAKVVEPKLRRDGTLEVEVTVTNTGMRAGREIVQLYVRQTVASRSRPLRQLKGIASVDLAPGEKRRVRIAVPVAELGYHDDEGRLVIEPGPFRAFVGASSAADTALDFEVIGE